MTPELFAQLASGPARDRPDRLAISPSRFRRVAEFIHRELGIRMTDAKVPLLQSRLQRRIGATDCASLEEYLELVIATDATNPERAEFIDAVTTNKTDFFREPRHFTYLRHEAVPALDPDPVKPWSLRAWSAGCSLGMEAYTMAMVLAEAGAARGFGFDFEILGTDVSRRVLAAARAAIYDEAAIEPVPAALRAKYLLRSRDPAQARVRIGPELRARVDFRHLNFMACPYDVPAVFDVIFFRNVMIYFAKATQEKVVNALCERLRPGGYLFIGHSESLVNLDVPLRNVGAAVYRKS